MVPPVVVALAHEEFIIALLIYALAGFSDGLDGYIAKRYNYVSRLGSILDPLADKLLLVSTYVVLSWLGLLPVWLLVAVIGRDLLIVIGGAAYHVLIGQYEMAPTIISKVNTFMQIVLGLTLIFSAGIWTFPVALLEILVYVVFVCTVASGIDYVWTWSMRAHQARKLVRDGQQGKIK